MYIFGGYNGATDQHFNDFFRYDPGTEIGFLPIFIATAQTRTSMSHASFYSFFLENGVWTKIVPYGSGPAPRRRQGCVILDSRAFFFGGTSPNDSVVIVNYGDDMMEESNLVDHDDLYVLDLGEAVRKQTGVIPSWRGCKHANCVLF